MQSLSCAVIIPAHNAERTIGAAIRSAQAQTRLPLEIIVSLDRCTDSTESIAHSLGARTVIPTVSGPSAARNAAAAAAEADILFFLDSDDEWLPEKVQQHLEIWEREKPSFVMDPCRRVWESGSQGGVGGGGKEGALAWEAMIDRRNWSCGSAVSISRDIFKEIGGFREDLFLSEDIEILIRAAHEFGPGYRLSTPLTLYMQSSGSLSRKKVDAEAAGTNFFAKLPFATEAQKETYKSTIRLSSVFFAPANQFAAELKQALPKHWHDPELYRLLIVRMVRRFQNRSSDSKKLKPFNLKPLL